MAPLTIIRQKLNAFVDHNLSQPARAARIARFARAERDKLINAGRASPVYQTYVDGRLGAAEEQVKPGGTIFYQFVYLREVVPAVLEFLKQRSPVASGRYRDSFYIAVDGRFFLAREFRIEALPASAEITIGNTQPYSRKVDVQLIGTRKLSFSVPSGLFDDAVKFIQGRWGNLVTVKRVYTMAFPGQYRLKIPQMRGDAPHRVKRRAGTPVESPAIIINPRR